MEPVPVFVKTLTDADINRRLYFPTRHMSILPPFAPGSNEVGFRVRYGDEEGEYTFWCKRRRIGSPKPTIGRGWLDVVRDRQLQIGDELRFYVEGGEPTRYRIEVWRLQFSNDYADNWIRF